MNGVDRIRRRNRRVALNIFLWLVAALAVALWAYAYLDPEGARRAGEAPPDQGLAPETPMDALPLPVYAAMLGVCGWQLWRVRGRADRRPLWVLLGSMAAWLLWRELPWDERVLGDANTWSWAKYLDAPEVPLWARVVLGGGSIAATVLLVAYAVRRGKALGRLVREKFASLSGWVFLAGGVLLGAAQALDKYASIDKHLGTNLAAWKADGRLGFLEESLELIGPLFLLMACILGVLETPARPAAPPDGAEPAG